MKSKAFNKKERKDLIFCLLVLLVPMVQFAIFYIGVNANSFVMAFQKYETNEITLKGSYKFLGFKDLFHNFDWMFTTIKDEGIFMSALKNSFLAFFVITLVGITLALVFSMYISKKMPGSGLFRALLFAPSILSAMVTVLIFKSVVEEVIPVLFHLKEGLYANLDTRMGTILFYNVWIGFGTQVLMYSGAMSGIDPSITEAARLDGASPFREFFSITLPLIYPTIQTFLITGVANIFLNQINLVAFDGLDASGRFMTVGYYLFSGVEFAMKNSKEELLLFATYGVSLTLIAAPLTLLTRWALDKFGPSVE